MKKLLEPRYLALIGIFSVVILFSTARMAHLFSQQQIQLYQASSGLGVCQKRVVQSFTALMIKQLDSHYLEQNFRQMSADCLSEVSDMLESVTDNATVLGPINTLKSDLHWFNQKIDRILKLIQQENIDIRESNITDKFSELEDGFSKLENSVLTESVALKDSVILSNLANVLSLVLLALISGTFLLRRSLESKTKGLENINSLASLEMALTKFLPSDLLASSLDLVRQLDQEKMKMENKLIQLHTEGHDTSRIELEVPQEVISLNVENKTQSEVHLQRVTKNVLQKLRPRLASERVIINAENQDDFLIYGEEENIQQLLYSLLSYSIDCLGEREEKSLKLVSKALGGIAYCKVILEGYHFSDEERSILSGHDHTVESSSVNLSLCKELMRDSGLKFGVKNKQDSEKNIVRCEVEIIFERVMTEDKLKKDPQTKIVKGHKADIRKYFDQQLS